MHYSKPCYCPATVSGKQKAELIKTLPIGSPVKAIAKIRNGVAIGTNSGVQIWKTWQSNGELLHTIPIKDGVESLAYSSIDGSIQELFVGTSRDVQIWKVNFHDLKLF